MKVFHRNKKAFTLIELVVVIAIIAVLASIVTVSTIAILRNAEKKTVSSKLSSTWSTTSKVMHQINHGYTTATLKDLLKTRLGASTSITTSTDKCSAQWKTEDGIFIQYEYNSQSLMNRYKLVCIWTYHKGNYYYTTDGETMIGPKSAP